MEVIPKESRHFMSFCLEDTHRTHILKGCIYLLWSHGANVSEFSCLTKRPKPYPVCGPTYLPQIHNKLHCNQKTAHRVLITTYLPYFTLKSFALFINHWRFVLKATLSFVAPFSYML